MDYLIVEDGSIINIVVAEPDIAKELGLLPWYDGARIGAAYTPPAEAQPPTVEERVTAIENAIERGLSL